MCDRPSRRLRPHARPRTGPNRRPRARRRIWRASARGWSRLGSRRPSCGATSRPWRRRARAGAADAQKALSDARAEAEKVSKQRADLEQAVSGLSANRDKEAADLDRVSQQLQQARDSLAMTQRDVAAAKSDRDRITAERGQAEAAVKSLQSTRDGLNATLEELRKRRARA